MAEIYVDTYAKYNQCRTGGRWVDCDDFYDKESFMEHCREIHSDESDPELMFSDHSDIPSAFISESSVSEALWLWLESSQKDAIEAYLECLYTSSVDNEAEWEILVDAFEDAFIGGYSKLYP